MPDANQIPFALHGRNNPEKLPYAQQVANLLTESQEEPFGARQIARRLLLDEAYWSGDAPSPEAAEARARAVKKTSTVLGNITIAGILAEQDLALQKGRLQQGAPGMGLYFRDRVYRATAFDPASRREPKTRYQIAWDDLSGHSLQEQRARRSDPFFPAGEPLVSIDEMFRDVSFRGWSPAESVSRILSKVPGRPYTFLELGSFIFPAQAAIAEALPPGKQQLAACRTLRVRIGTILQTQAFEQSLKGRTNALQAGRILNVGGQKVGNMKVCRAIPDRETMPKGDLYCGPYEVEWGR